MTEAAFSQSDLDRLYLTLRPPFGPDGGVVLQMLASSTDVELATAEVSRAFAQAALKRIDGSVCLLDLDPEGEDHFAALAPSRGGNRRRRRAKELFPAQLGFDPGSLWNVVDDGGEPAPNPMSFHRVGEGRLFVSRYTGAPKAANMLMRHPTPFWDGLRDEFDLTVVASPSPERSNKGLDAACEGDAMLIVGDRNRGKGSHLKRTKNAVENVGGITSGILLLD